MPVVTAANETGLIQVTTRSSGSFSLTTGLFVRGSAIGINTKTPGYSLAITATDGLLVPVGTTAQRPTGAAGVIRHNTTRGILEAYNATEWAALTAYGYTPSSTADSAGATGDITYDTSFIYIKTASGWYRAALSSF